jgi:hypothetical protein
MLDALGESIDGREGLICILRMLGSSGWYLTNNIYLHVLSQYNLTTIKLNFLPI